MQSPRLEPHLLVEIHRVFLGQTLKDAFQGILFCYPWMAVKRMESMGNVTTTLLALDNILRQHTNKIVKQLPFITLSFIHMQKN